MAREPDLVLHLQRSCVEWPFEQIEDGMIGKLARRASGAKTCMQLAVMTLDSVDIFGRRRRLDRASVPSAAKCGRHWTPSSSRSCTTGDLERAGGSGRVVPSKETLISPNVSRYSADLGKLWRGHD